MTAILKNARSKKSSKLSMHHAFLTHMSMGFQMGEKSNKKELSPDKHGGSPETKKSLKQHERNKIARTH